MTKLDDEEYETRILRARSPERSQPVQRYRLRGDRTAFFAGRRYRPHELVECYDDLTDVQKALCEPTPEK